MPAVMSLTNTDMQAAVPFITQRLDSLRAACQNLLQLWQVRKMKLEQCFQLRLFESDIEKVSHRIRFRLQVGTPFYIVHS